MPEKTGRFLGKCGGGRNWFSVQTPPLLPRMSICKTHTFPSAQSRMRRRKADTKKRFFGFFQGKGIALRERPGICVVYRSLRGYDGLLARSLALLARDG